MSLAEDVFMNTKALRGNDFKSILNGTTVINQKKVIIFFLNILILSSHLRLGLPKGLFPIGFPVKIFKPLLPSSILATCPGHLHLK